jgi:hypothetical protein
MIAAVLALWVTVMNPDGIKNYNGSFAFGETCVVESLAAVKQEGPLDETQTLYRLLSAKTSAAGTLCPKGTLFVMTPAQLESLQAKERSEREAFQRTQQQIRDTLRSQ